MPQYAADFKEAAHMSKKVVVVTGSPRKNGNSFAMTDAFIQAAQAKGHTVTRFDAAMMKIGGCHACETCYKTGKACSFDDDFNTIAPAILEADAVVFTMPVYWYSIPAQIKGVIDRMFSFVVGGKSIAGKECAIIACCEEAEMDVMDAVRIPLERSAALMKWDMVGEVLVPGVLNAGDIAKTDGCAQAAALAEKF
jgi:multimeric flavodoxin WrbA